MDVPKESGPCRLRECADRMHLESIAMDNIGCVRNEEAFHSPHIAQNRWCCCDYLPDRAHGSRTAGRIAEGGETPWKWKHVTRDSDAGNFVEKVAACGDDNAEVPVRADSAQLAEQIEQ